MDHKAASFLNNLISKVNKCEISNFQLSSLILLLDFQNYQNYMYNIVQFIFYRPQSLPDID